MQCRFRRQPVLNDALPHLSPQLKGFNVVKDTGDKYLFAYPFGWQVGLRAAVCLLCSAQTLAAEARQLRPLPQEVTVDGADVVYKDIIEPLESVSVTLVPTDKKTLNEFGTAEEVAETLATRVLTSPK